MPPRIQKADGTFEPFNRGKLFNSLIRTGATKGRAEEITEILEGEIREHMTTGEIYHRAFALLGEQHKAAARYSLKRAILDFGPSGFPFEAYLAHMFQKEGYTTLIDQIITGKCVQHEVDVVAKKDATTLYVEAKFHNSIGFKTDLETALYVKARLDDIAGGGPENSHSMRGMLVTNTKFTSVAITYAQCADIELLAWDFPEKHNLHDRIEAANIYPITALTTLNKQDKLTLLDKKIVLCNDLPQQKDALIAAGVSPKKIDAVFSEAAGLCIPGKGI